MEATWLATTRVLSLKVRERTLETRLLDNNLCSVYSYKQELCEIQNFINKKKSFVILRTSWYRGSLCRVSSVYKFQTFSSLWTGSLFGKINSKERSSLDQRPVHKLNSYCCFYWIYVLKRVWEKTLETRLLVLIIYARYTAISKSFIKSKTSSITKKTNPSLYWGLRYIEVRYAEVPVYIHSKFLAAFIEFTY